MLADICQTPETSYYYLCTCNVTYNQSFDVPTFSYPTTNSTSNAIHLWSFLSIYSLSRNYNLISYGLHICSKQQHIVYKTIRQPERYIFLGLLSRKLAVCGNIPLSLAMINYAQCMRLYMSVSRFYLVP